MNTKDLDAINRVKRLPRWEVFIRLFPDVLVLIVLLVTVISILGGWYVSQ